MSFTISLIPTSLSLVHIPRTRLEQLSHPIIKQILQANTSFLNITCNELEICIFGDSPSLIDDFEPIARRDRQRQRSRQGSASSSSGRYNGLDRRKTSRNNSLPLDPVEISYEKWSVIQVDSHSDGTDDSGARVHSVSAPLSAAGISILYQSSYMSDYIFVKEWRLQEVISILTSAGFSMYTADSSLLFTPAASVPQSPNGSEEFPTPATCDDAPHADDGTNGCSATSSEPRGKSHSPASVGQIRVLSSDLVCVGLDDNIDNWGLKVIKLLAYPDLIFAPESSGHRSQPQPRRSGSTSSPVNDKSTGSDDLDADGNNSSDSSDIDEEGYFSDSPQTDKSTSSVYTSASLSSRSQTDVISSIKLPSTSPSKHLINIVFPMSPIAVPVAPSSTRSSLRISTDLGDGAQVSPEPKYKVPFFSFTRTMEGCSLTTNVRLLAALFPPHERHVIMCSGQLEKVVFRDDDDGLQEGDDEISEGEQDGQCEKIGQSRANVDEGDDSFDSSNLRCLQIDLSMFGLEKHGLINKFSRVLGENNINHMYSCTLKTANILVDKRNVRYARSLLRSC
jgi:hypothetical protein